MTRAVWDNLLEEARRAHRGALAEFCDFPTDLSEQPVAPYHIHAADLFARDRAAQEHPLARAFQVASPIAQWRQTYRGTHIFPDFMRRFGCYCLIGAGGAFSSQQMNAYVVYMPPRLDYPFHHHPAEEIYTVLAGSAKFRRDDAPDEVLGPGMSSLHSANQPHATRTYDEPLIAYVVWRNGLGVKPIWTEEALR